MAETYDDGTQSADVFEALHHVKLPPGIEVTPDYGPYGQHYLYRPNEILVAEEDVPLVRDRLQGNGLRLQPFSMKELGDEACDLRDIEALGVVRYELGDDAPRQLVPDLVMELRKPVEYMDSSTREVVTRYPRVHPVHFVPLSAHAPWHPATPPSRTTPLGALPQPAPGEVLPGHGVTVAVLDTGLDRTNRWFEGRAVSRGAEDDDPLAIGRPQDGRPFPCGGHGTFIAGQVLKHAPGARVLVRKLPEEDPGYVADPTLAAAILAVAGPDVDIISLSLGAPTHDDAGLPMTAAAIDRVTREYPHIAIVASSGNEGSSRVHFPAGFANVYAVAAITAQKGTPARASFSNYGWWIDACSPGVEPKSAFFNREGFNGFATWSGTSFAAPTFAAAVAVRMSPGGENESRRMTARQAAALEVADPANPRLADMGTVVRPHPHVT